jgi:hypothetical protein
MKRTSWILLILLGIAVGVYFLIKYRAEIKTTEPTETPVTTSYLAQEIDGTLISIRIFDNDYHIVVMQRNQDGFWEITLPTPGTADQALVSEAETQLNALKTVSRIGQVVSLDDFGLTHPAYIIKMVYSNNAEHKIDIGDSTPTGSGYYIQLDDGEVYVVSQYSLDAILGMLSNPPYPATATPTPTLEQPTPTSTLEYPSVTPEEVQPTP